jgi:pimeloyl-ACP methyl ester carboxylesterase
MNRLFREAAAAASKHGPRSADNKNNKPSSASPPPNPLAEAARRRVDAFPSEAAAAGSLSQRSPYKHLDPRCLALYLAHGLERPGPEAQLRLRCRPDTEARIFEMLPTQEEYKLFDRLSEIRCPVVVARGQVGAGAHALLALSAPLIARQCPRGRLREFPALYHMGPLEDPDAVGRAFLEELAREHAVRREASEGGAAAATGGSGERCPAVAPPPRSRL